jgi:hypothetical protein
MNYTPSNVVKFTGSPQSVDSANADTKAVSQRFTDCPRGRTVKQVDVCDSVKQDSPCFVVPDASVRELSKLYRHEWNSFRSMKYRRCGKSGKYVCHPDIDTFPKFLAAFGPIPGPGYTLDRLDPTDLEYAPGKCEWACKQRQAENKSNVKYLTTSDGTCLHVSEWSRRTGLDRKTILRRLELGWSDNDAVGIKAGGKRSAPRPQNKPSTKSLFPDAAPAHLQNMLYAFTEGLAAHHNCDVFLLEWKHIPQLEYLHEGLLRCGVPPAQVVAMVVERWHRFAPHKNDPVMPSLMYLKQNVMPAAHYYLMNGGTRLTDDCPDQCSEPTTPLDLERDL